jgi:propionyl-CoA carboxylase alpha chain
VTVEIDWDSTHDSLDLVYTGRIDEAPVAMQHVGSTYNTLRIQHIGTVYEVKVESELEHKLAAHMPVVKKRDLANLLVSPMPGKVISINVQPGDKVALGQQVAVVEAMKMQNILRSPKDGIVSKVLVVPGVDVAVDQVLVEFQKDE